MVFCYLQAYGYSKIGITLCPSEWYQYLNFWYLAHGLLELNLPFHVVQKCHVLIPQTVFRGCFAFYLLFSVYDNLHDNLITPPLKASFVYSYLVFIVVLISFDSFFCSFLSSIDFVFTFVQFFQLNCQRCNLETEVR